jgi:hypothetical protein
MLVRGRYEMIACVQVAVMLHVHGLTTGRPKDAKRWFLTQPGHQCYVKALHDYPAYVAPDPFVEDGDQEVPVSPGRHRALRHLLAWLESAQAVALDDRDELDEGHPQFVPEEAIHFQRMAGVGTVHTGQDVKLHPVLFQDFQPTHHPVKGRPAPLVQPVGVVQLARPVDADAHQHVVFPEKLAPFVVQLVTIWSANLVFAIGFDREPTFVRARNYAPFRT